MPTSITRRDILKFTGGGILGIMFSPLPWKLLDDSAIWTQNWSLTPPLPHGPITTAFSHCILCDGGCAVKAQCVNGIPYYLSGIPNHPVSHGSLCPRGIAGHHMAYHLLRIVHPHTFTGRSGDSSMAAVSLQEALENIAAHIKGTNGSVAIFDQQPGRAVSGIYRKFAGGLTKGILLTSPSREDATTAAVQSMTNAKNGSYGFDFENTRLVLSFGAPLFDGWGTPGRMTAVRNAGRAKFVQIDPRYSRTAMQADQWIAPRPGTEKFLALGIAHVLIAENLVSPAIKQSAADFARFKSLVSEFSPEKMQTATGIDAAAVASIARELAVAESAIVLSGSDPGGGPFDEETEKAVAAINLLIGSVGKSGGIVVRTPAPGSADEPAAASWRDVPDRSIGVLIVDGADSGYAVPWNFIEKKLIPGSSIVVSLSPVLNDISAHADYLIPSPAYLESLTDVPASSGSSVATFALSLPLLKKPENSVEPADVIKEICSRVHHSSDIPSQEELLKRKVEAIFTRNQGTLYRYADESTVNIADLSSADELWTALTEGAVWIDEPAKQTKPVAFTFGVTSIAPAVNEIGGIPLIAYGWRGTTSAAQSSPILSKLFQETELRNGNGTVSLNPVTARQNGLSEETPATISTRNGSMTVRIKVDPTVRPGIMEASVGPLPNGAETPKHPAGNTILSLCEIADDGTWKITTANLLKV